jgi:Gnt-I system high-affinity gluconate transporter
LIDGMTILIILLALLILILLIAWARFHPFLAFLIVSLLTGWMLGIPVEKLSSSVKTGIGSMLGELAVIICLGAMLGKLVAETGAAQRISDSLIHLFGKKHLQWAMMLTGFVVGIPLFYNVGFVLLVPLAFAVIYRTGANTLFITIPMLAALSVTHGFLPPHPSPVALSVQLNAVPGKVLLYGIIIAVPAIIVAGPLFAKTLLRIKTPPLQLFQQHEIKQQLPGVFSSYIAALLPALLLIIFSIVPIISSPSENIKNILAFAGDPIIILLLSVIFATYVLGLRNQHSLRTIMNYYGEAVKEVAVILLIIAGAGALKQVLVDSGVSSIIAQQLGSLQVNALILGWFIAAVIRVCLGSATVAGLTAAGIAAPLVVNGSANPELMVLSVGAGSLMFSHVNDSGFWMFKEYFNLSVKDTIRSWSVMETIVAVMGLIGVLVLDLFI